MSFLSPYKLALELGVAPQRIGPVLDLILEECIGQKTSNRNFIELRSGAVVHRMPKDAVQVAEALPGQQPQITGIAHEYADMVDDMLFANLRTNSYFKYGNNLSERVRNYEYSAPVPVKRHNELTLTQASAELGVPLSSMGLIYKDLKKIWEAHYLKREYSERLARPVIGELPKFGDLEINTDLMGERRFKSKRAKNEFGFCIDRDLLERILEVRKSRAKYARLEMDGVATEASVRQDHIPPTEFLSRYLKGVGLPWFLNFVRDEIVPLTSNDKELVLICDEVMRRSWIGVAQNAINGFSHVTLSPAAVAAFRSMQEIAPKLKGEKGNWHYRRTVYDELHTLINHVDARYGLGKNALEGRFREVALARMEYSQSLKRLWGSVTERGEPTEGFLHPPLNIDGREYSHRDVMLATVAGGAGQSVYMAKHITYELLDVSKLCGMKPPPMQHRLASLVLGGRDYIPVMDIMLEKGEQAAKESGIAPGLFNYHMLKSAVGIQDGSLSADYSALDSDSFKVESKKKTNDKDSVSDRILYIRKDDVGGLLVEATMQARGDRGNIRQGKEVRSEWVRRVEQEEGTGQRTLGQVLEN